MVRQASLRFREMSLTRVYPRARAWEIDPHCLTMECRLLHQLASPHLLLDDVQLMSADL